MQRKKTALRTRVHRKASAPNHESGLIVTAKNAGRSARTTRAVDNRSHRTPLARTACTNAFCKLLGPIGPTVGS